MLHRTSTAATARRSAFTLVELLVVIGVIAVLISLLLPVLAAARQQARTLTCASNLRQIGVMFAMYAVDNNNYYPPLNWLQIYNPDVPNKSNSYGMVHCLGPYMNQPQWSGISMTSPYFHSFDATDKAVFRRSVFVCPDYTPNDPILPYLSGVAESGWLVTTKSPDQSQPRRLSAMRRPASELIHVADSYHDYILKDGPTLVRGGRSFDVYRHNKHTAGNILFLDQHVATFRGDYVKANVTQYLTLK